MKLRYLIFLTILTVSLGFNQVAFAWDSYDSDVEVNGYYRSNGPYVESYTRTRPDSNPYNNYSSPKTLPSGMPNYERPYNPYGR